MRQPPLVGIFVGGRALRFRGVAKGLLPAPDGSGPLIARLVRVARSALGEPRVVLVGLHPAYQGLQLPQLADRPAGVGPLGGLCALLHEARHDHTDALAFACDLPYVTSRLMTRLVSPEFSHAAAVAPRIGDRWEPLCARYDPEPCLEVAQELLSARRHALHSVLDRLGERAAGLELTAEDGRQLQDWDSPSDLTTDSE